MRELMRCVKLASQSAIKPLWLLIAVAVLFQPHAALAQAGSTGGNVGKQDKSVSGGQDESTKPSRAKKASPKPGRSASAREQAGAPEATGEWKGVSSGSCIIDWSWTLQISSAGAITGDRTTGHVGRGGAGNGTMRVLGKDYYFAGHFGPSKGSGTWKRKDGCTGKWTGTRL
jgi:hypothetical protein